MALSEPSDHVAFPTSFHWHGKANAEGALLHRHSLSPQILSPSPSHCCHLPRMHRLRLALFLALPFSPLCAATPDPAHVEIPVLVLNYNPVLAGKGGARLREHMKWNDPRPMAEHLMQYIKEASGGYAQ